MPILKFAAKHKGVLQKSTMVGYYSESALGCSACNQSKQEAVLSTATDRSMFSYPEKIER